MIVAKKIQQEQGTNHIPEGYSYRSGYFVSLAERYAIDGRLLGRRIKLYDNDICMSIVFPSVIVKDRIPYIGIPKLLETYGVDMEDWGKINNYQSLDRPETIHAWLSTVFVECHAKERDKLVKPAIVQKYAKKVVYALQIINPDVIRISSDEVINDICEVKESVSFNEDGRPQAETRITFFLTKALGTAVYISEVIDMNQKYDYYSVVEDDDEEENDNSSDTIVKVSDLMAFVCA